MSIKSDLEEWKSIKMAIKQLTNERQKLQSQLKKCESNILTYLNESNQNAIRLGDLVFKNVQGQKRLYAPAKTKIDKAKNELKYNKNISVEELYEILKGDKEECQMLKIERKNK
jgi:hypothetical protein